MAMHALMPGERPHVTKMGRERFGMPEDGDELDEAAGRISALREKRDRGYKHTREDIEHVMEPLHLARNGFLDSSTPAEPYDARSHGRDYERDRTESEDEPPNRAGVSGRGEHVDPDELEAGVYSKLSSTEVAICSALGISHRDFAVMRGTRK